MDILVRCADIPGKVTGYPTEPPEYPFIYPDAILCIAQKWAGWDEYMTDGPRTKGQAREMVCLSLAMNIRRIVEGETDKHGWTPAQVRRFNEAVNDVREMLLKKGGVEVVHEGGQPLVLTTATPADTDGLREVEPILPIGLIHQEKK
jgi:hypothetical protein